MREEYPRPSFARKDWLCLNGEWNFEAEGKKPSKIQVPFVYQSKLSGIWEDLQNENVRYNREFTVPKAWKNQRILLHFGAVDYSCTVTVNGKTIGAHEGGNTPFSFDITDALTWQNEQVQVDVFDPITEETIPRGKQFWAGPAKFIWYTPSTGIWQSVWLEPVNKTRFEWIRFTPDIDEGTVKINYRLNQMPAKGLIGAWQVKLKDDGIFNGEFSLQKQESSFTVDIFTNRILINSFWQTGNCWAPETPTLYDFNAQLKLNGEILDSIESYFGMRKIHIENGYIYLNNYPYYQRLVLDQGYWPNSLITAPSDEAFKQDILLAKELGFNGCRKHEKVEDPRFLYWADKLGFLVYESMASCWSYSPDSVTRFTKEWIDVINRDYNHPCIVVWDMLNESWGVPEIRYDKKQQNFSQALYHLAHAMDGSRLVISNDGWEMTDTDICAIHTYSHGQKGDVQAQEHFANAVKSFDKLATGNLIERLPFAKGFEYKNQPIILTEMGGISIANKGGWGYTSTTNTDDFLDEYARVFDAIYASSVICGFCYTQLTDLQQETNGLLTFNREFKVDPVKIREINTKKHFA